MRFGSCLLLTTFVKRSALDCSLCRKCPLSCNSGLFPTFHQESPFVFLSMDPRFCQEKNSNLYFSCPINKATNSAWEGKIKAYFSIFHVPQTCIWECVRFWRVTQTCKVNSGSLSGRGRPWGWAWQELCWRASIHTSLAWSPLWVDKPVRQQRFWEQGCWREMAWVPILTLSVPQFLFLSIQAGAPEGLLSSLSHIREEPRSVLCPGLNHRCVSDHDCKSQFSEAQRNESICLRPHS